MDTNRARNFAWSCGGTALTNNDGNADVVELQVRRQLTKLPFHIVVLGHAPAAMLPLQLPPKVQGKTVDHV